MSICDEDWPAVWNGDASELDFCPCAMTYGGCGGRVIGCTLGVWHEWLAVETAQEPPGYCPHYDPLRTVLHHSDLVLDVRRTEDMSRRIREINRYITRHQGHMP